MKTPRRIAYLSTEIPAASASFITEEISHLRGLGHSVTPFSLKRVPKQHVPAKAADIAKETRSLYANPPAVLLGITKLAITHPRSVMRTTKHAIDDMRNGDFRAKERKRFHLVKLALGLALAERIRALDIEHLHVHFADLPATIGMYAADAAKCSLSITAHDSDLYAYGALLEQKVSRADLFTTVSFANRGYLLERLGTAAAGVRVLHSGVDISAFEPRQTECGTHTNVIFTAGPLQSRKGFDVLIYSMALMAEARPELRLAIAGEGPQRGRLERLIERLGLRDRVSLLGKVSRDDIHTHLSAAALFALPCREALSGDRDAIPVSLIEAMACRVPVVSTRFSGIPELVDHGKSGLLVNPEDPVDLAAGIGRLLDDAAMRNELQQAARESVEKRFDVHDNVEHLCELIDDAVKRHAGKQATRPEAGASAAPKRRWLPTFGKKDTAGEHGAAASSVA